MCTVLLRWHPGAAWPLLLAAVRDEFVDRAWDPPDTHWPDTAPGLVGGRDRVAGGTWLAVRPQPPAVAALLNGARLAPAASGSRPSRGGLPLALLTGPLALDAAAVAGYDGFHLVLGRPDGVSVWTWDGTSVATRTLAPGDHVLVNAGIDLVDDPLTAHFMPLLSDLPQPPLAPGTGTALAWGSWVELLRGDRLAPDDPRALVVRRTYGGRTYGSTSASLVAVSRHAVRFDFTASPDRPAWSEVGPARAAAPRASEATG